MPGLFSISFEQRARGTGGAFVANHSQCGGGNVEITKSSAVVARGGSMLICIICWAKIYRPIRIMQHLQYMLGRFDFDAVRKLHSVEEVKEYINYWDMERKNLPVATDGMVFRKVNSLRQQKNLGYTAKSPALGDSLCSKQKKPLRD